MLCPLLALFFACDYYSSEVTYDSFGGTGGSMARFACIGNRLYVVDDTYLQTFDISDSSKITRTASVVASWGSSIETIFPKDSLLFLGSTRGMYIFNLKVPDKPAFVSVIEHFTSCDPVVVQGIYAFVTLRTDNDGFSCNRGVNQLHVIDVSNLSEPVTKGIYEMKNPRGLAVDGTKLFVCDGMDLAVFDVSDPLHVTEIKRFELDGTPYDVIAKNGTLMLTYSAGLRQYSYVGDTIQEISTLY